MLPLKRKSPPLDPYYRPGFMSQKKLREIMQKQQASASKSPRADSGKGPVSRVLNLEKQTTASKAAPRPGVFERVAMCSGLCFG